MLKEMGEYETDDPMWVIGVIDAYGVVSGRVVQSGETHTPEERISGRPFRWNIWGQDFHPVVWSGRIACITDREDTMQIRNWLEENGYKRREKAA